MVAFAAALIVRDEVERLPACLASLQGIVDAVHVHDTGSTDGTPQLAASQGAVVTEGPWSDDFAAARNAALTGWSADWVLSIDADEVVVADPAALRGLLTAAEADVGRVAIDIEQDGAVYRESADRLFRPAAVHWEGRVHEQLVGHHGPAPTITVPPEVLRLRHHGYASASVRRAKAERNVALARAALDELVAQGDATDPTNVATTLVDLGRSLLGAGQRQDALDTFEAVRELAPGTPQWLEATDFLARLVLAAGMDDVCLALVAQLRAAGADTSYCDWLEAQAVAQLGDGATARRLLAGVTEVVDLTGRRHDPASLTELKSLVARLP